ESWLNSTAMPRVHPGASVIVVHTRWHEDDLIGRLEKKTDEDDDGNKVRIWETVNLPAVREDGTPLWHKRPLKWLKRQRATIGEYDWWSIYMGSPRRKGGELFKGLYFYEPNDRPTSGFEIAIGVDLAYSEKKRADWSVAV